jgi:hypothetical protein
MSCLRYLCLFVPSGVQHILCFVFVFFVLLPVSLDFNFDLKGYDVMTQLYLCFFKYYPGWDGCDQYSVENLELFGGS